MTGLISRATLVVAILATCALATKCPAGCYCDEKRGGDDDKNAIPDGAGLRVNCHPLVYGTLDFGTLPRNTVQLDLARYGLKEVTAKMFVNTPYLQKLDLQNNDIEHVEEGSFADLAHLQLLDLSRNSLEFINSEMFSGLGRLDRLKLNDNSIQTVESGAFDDLRSLARIEISENPFMCDCNLAWFLRWLETRKEGVLANALKTRCSLPIEFADAPLKKVNPDSLVCAMGVPPSGTPGKPAQVPTMQQPGGIQLSPSDSQVAFEDDAFEMSCKLDRKSRSQKMTWLIRGQPVGASKNVTITTSPDFQDGSERSILKVTSLRSPHSGEWTCLVEDDARGEEFHRSANVLVITATTRLCNPLRTSTSRGDYSFGTAVGGHTVQQSCDTPKQGRPFGFAYLLCRENGEWADTVNASQCAYTNHVTDTLHKFATMNMTFTPKTLLESARQFLNFTDDPGVFRDEMDLVYFSRAVGNYLPYLERIGGVGDLGHYMLSMVENAMDVGSARLAAQSQLRDHAMERLLHVVNNVTAFLPSFQHHTNKLAVEAYDIRPVNFDGVTCTWYESLSTAYQRFSPKRVFHCAETNKTLPTRGKVVLASVALPKSIYGQIMSVHQQYEDDNKSRRDGRRNRNRNLLVFSTYNNATLFPTTVPEPRFEDVSSLVIGVQHGELHYEEFGNLADPVNIVIQSAAIPDHPKLQVQPVWWDASANNGFGSWRSDYCQLVEAKASLVWFKCWRLGHYGYRLMSPGLIYESHHARFRFHHPLVYIGSFCCIGLIVSAVVIYAISFHSIMISRKLKHALVNIWVASSSLVFLFVTGIHQTENDAVCKGVGVAAHYLTLCSLVWLVVSVSIIYKKANSQKLSQSSRQNNAAFLDRGNQNRNESSNSRFRQPISRLYLIGWGISALVCAISAAFDIDNYGTPTHCFMKLVPFLAGVVLPLAVLTALMIGFSLSAWCVVSTPPSHITEQFEVDDLNNVQRGLARGSSSTVSTMGAKPDLEKTVKSLLLSHGYIYVLFLSTWMCGSLAVLEPLKGNLPYEELIFAVLFTVSSISLGVFVFVYFCASRQDVQECWRSPFCVSYAGRRCMRARGTAAEAAAANLVDPDRQNYQLQQQQQQQQQQPPQLPNPEYAGGLLPPPRLQNAQGFAPGGINPLPQQGYGPPGQQQLQLQQLQHDSFKIYEGPSIASSGFRPSAVKAVNIFKKESGESSCDRISLNHINHLRRGYVAPVNSEADYGIYTGGPPSSSVFGPSSSCKVNNTNIHVEPALPLISSKVERMHHQPKTSSPLGSAVPFTDQDLTLVSPLVRTQQQQQPKEEDPTLDSVNGNGYTESPTIKVGAPCQMASFTTVDFPRLPPGFVSKPGVVKDPFQLQQQRQQQQQRRKNRELFRAVAENEDAIDRASDLEQLEVQSKLSVSSAYSNRSGKKRKPRNKKPNRRRQIKGGVDNEEDDDDDEALVAASGNVARNEWNRRQQLSGSVEDNYMGDDDNFDTLERLKEEEKETRGDEYEEETAGAPESISESVAAVSKNVISDMNEDEDGAATTTTSQYSSSEVPTRETCV